MIALVELIAKIYAASLDRSLWWRVTEDLATLTSCNRIWLFGQGADFVPTAGHLPKIPINQVIDFVRKALAAQGQSDSGGGNEPEGALVVTDQFYWIPLQRNPSARVLVPRADSQRLFALALSKESREACDTVRREADEQPARYDPAQLISDLAPHLISSYEIARTLSRNHVYLGGAEPKIGRQAVFLLGTNGRVLFATPAAQDLVREKDGGLRVEGGTLKPAAMWNPSIASSGSIRNGQAANLAPTSTWLSVSRGRGTLPLFALLFTLDREKFFQDAVTPRTILVVCDPEMRAPQVAALLRQTWPLTAAEARVAAQLFLGRGIDEVADKLNVKRETIRTHLKRAYAKTGTSNQAELVAFIAAIQSIYFPF